MIGLVRCVFFLGGGGREGAVNKGYVNIYTVLYTYAMYRVHKFMLNKVLILND